MLTATYSAQSGIPSFTPSPGSRMSVDVPWAHERRAVDQREQPLSIQRIEDARRAWRLVAVGGVG